MQRSNLILGLSLLVGGGVAVAAAWNILFTVPAASGEVTAVPVATRTEAPAQATATEGTLAASPTETQAGGSQRTYTLVQAESEVRFVIGEILFGEPKTVIGVNDQVAAQILLDTANPQNSQLGVVAINARTFVTDNSTRNGAINNRILDSGTFEFITFTPTAYIGLPASGAVGQTFEFQIVGGLTIRDITNQVTFDVVLTVVSEERLEGSASAQIARADYDLVIPNVPQVAGVDEIVGLEIDFVALAD